MNLDPFKNEKEMARQALEEAKAARKLNEELLAEMREIRKVLGLLRDDINRGIPILSPSVYPTYTSIPNPISLSFTSTQAEDNK